MSAERLAIIDCGTNTFNLLVAEVSANGIRMLSRKKRVVKLGSSGLSRGQLSEKGKKRALSALSSYRQTAAELQVDRIVAIGTAALRDAKDGAQFLKQVKKETGLQIRLIDGHTEAALIYEGVKAGVSLNDIPVLIIDIGGGSTEFILCNQRKIFWKRSYRLGAARLLEHNPLSNPPQKPELMQLEKMLVNALPSLLQACRKFKPEILIGSSGSFDTFAAMMIAEAGEPRLRKSHYVFSLPRYHRLHRKLCRCTLAERLKIPGMLAMRADMIVPASALVTFVLQSTGIKKMHLSSYALKEGVLMRFFNKKKL